MNSSQIIVGGNGSNLAIAAGVQGESAATVSLHRRQVRLKHLPPRCHANDRCMHMPIKW